MALIKGAGDLASGVALRLHRAGFPVVMTELEHPLAVRRTVAFAQAVFEGTARVEEIEARCAALVEAPQLVEQGLIPVLVDPAAAAVAALRPAVVVDAIMAKRNTGTRADEAPVVVALGPGFTAGIDCHAVVETNRGHYLGRAIYRGAAQADTGEPGSLPGAGRRQSRVLRAPLAGRVVEQRAIGAEVQAGAVLAVVQSDTAQSDTVQSDGRASIVAPFDGVLRGMIHPSVPVTAGMKIGDLDPRAAPEYCFTVSDKSLAVGGGVLEAALHLLRLAQLGAAPPPPYPLFH